MNKLILPDGQVDERDTMFARMARVAGTAAYSDYYKNNPRLKKSDDRLRSMPPLLSRQGKYFDQVKSNRAGKYFTDIDQISPNSTEVDRYCLLLNGAKDKTTAIKDIIHELGAVAVGSTSLDREFIYSRKGRMDINYGQEIDLPHSDVIVFLVEMDYHRMQQAPRADTILESARQYYRAAEISQTATAVLQQAGYSARAHYDAHYNLILPPLAVKSGLGELGRNNILVADKYGSRVRIGAITTDLKLRADKPVDLGVDDFCRICKKCAVNCPSRALSMDEKDVVRGIEKWPTNIESCYSLWRSYGTDCGICMAVCPFSHRNNWFHNFIRFLIKKIHLIRPFALWLDNMIYKRWDR